MPPPLRAAAKFGIAYRPMGDEDFPSLAALDASTRAEEVALIGWLRAARIRDGQDEDVYLRMECRTAPGCS